MHGYIIDRLIGPGIYSLFIRFKVVRFWLYNVCETTTSKLACPIIWHAAIASCNQSMHAGHVHACMVSPLHIYKDKRYNPACSRLHYNLNLPKKELYIARFKYMHAIATSILQAHACTCKPS